MVLAGQLTIIQPHNHLTPGRVFEGDEANLSVIELHAFKNALKAKATSSLVKLADIYKLEAVRYPRGAALYPWHSACSLMTRLRRTGLPAQPETYADLDALFRAGALDRFCINGKNVYRGYTTDNNGKESVVFACHALVQLVLRYNPTNMFIDNSFKIVPTRPKTTQLLSVHFEINNCSVPVIYCLMEDNGPASYNSVICFIKNMLLPSYSPSNIFSDLNMDLITPLTYYFSGATIDCSWFHHNQMLFEKMIEFGYLNLIINSKITFRCLKMLMVLPVLPPSYIQSGFDEVKAYATRMRIHIPLIFDYYSWYWLRKIGSNNISTYLKPTKSNNNIVVFHKKLIGNFRIFPTIWSFLGGMCKLNNTYLPVANQLGNGIRPNNIIRSQLLFNHLSIKHNTCRLMEGAITVKDFVLKCSEALNGYEEHLMTYSLKLSMKPTVDQNVEVIDVETIEDDHKLQGQQHRQRIQQQQQEQKLELKQEPEQEQERQQQQQYSRTNGYCMLCRSSRQNHKYIIIPCGHSWICQNCRDKKLLTCPYCGRDINMIVRVLETS